MGTRFDLYVGKGKGAEWLGSYPFDGYPDGYPKQFFGATTEAAYRAAVSKFLADPEHADAATLPADGWPWPWKDSRMTDFAYTFADGRVWVSCFGHQWIPAPPPDEPPEWGDDGPKEEFPDMSDRKAVTFGRRSGLIVVAGGKIVN